VCPAMDEESRVGDVGDCGWDRYTLEVHSGQDILYHKDFYTIPFHHHFEGGYGSNVVVITPEFRTWREQDDPELELFRFPPMPGRGLQRLSRVHRFSLRSYEHLLTDFLPTVHPQTRVRLLDSLRQIWWAKQTGEGAGVGSDNHDE